MGDIYINNKDIHKPFVTPTPVSEEDINNNNTLGGLAHARGNTAEIIRAFPPRTRKLDWDEAFAADWIKHYVLEDFDGTRAMYAEDGCRIILAIADSDIYPIDLVAYAITKTYERNQRFRLDNAAAYTMKLLHDWQSQGFKTRKDVQESKDDWCHYA